MVYIPPPGCSFSLLLSPPEQGVNSEKLEPSRTVPLSCPREMEVKVQKESPKGMAKNEDNQVQNNGENDQNFPHKSVDVPLTSMPLETKGVLTSGKRSTGEVWMKAIYKLCVTISGLFSTGKRYSPLNKA